MFEGGAPEAADAGMETERCGEKLADSDGLVDANTDADAEMLADVEAETETDGLGASGDEPEVLAEGEDDADGDAVTVLDGVDEGFGSVQRTIPCAVTLPADVKSPLTYSSDPLQARALTLLLTPFKVAPFVVKAENAVPSHLTMRSAGIPPAETNRPPVYS